MSDGGRLPTRRAVGDLVRGSPAERRRPLPAALRLVLGLLSLVLLGTLLLMLPGVSNGRPLTLMEALFTSTSAVTVTGLTVVTTSVDLSRWGQLVVLLLVQAGGVGAMFGLALALRLARRPVALADRLALSESLGLNRPGAVLRLARNVFYGILVIEGLGALLLYVHWRLAGVVPAEDVLFYAIFHAVTAFCNAGFDLFAGLARYPRGVPGDTFSLLIMGTLIFAGGLGQDHLRALGAG